MEFDDVALGRAQIATERGGGWRMHAPGRGARRIEEQRAVQLDDSQQFREGIHAQRCRAGRAVNALVRAAKPAAPPPRRGKNGGTSANCGNAAARMIEAPSTLRKPP